MTVAGQRLVIAGGGLAGCLAALALHKARPDVPLTIVERSNRLGGNHLWSFFDTDLDPDQRALVEPLIVRHWPDHEVRFPSRVRRIDIGYNSVRSDRLDAVLRERLPADSFRFGRGVVEVGERQVTLEGGETIPASAVIDARGPTDMPGVTLGWQKFVGRDCRFERPHDIQRPVIMDARVDQLDGYRFVYLLPFDDHDAMIEDTYYADGPAIDRMALGRRIDSVAAAIDRGAVTVINEEDGALPVVIAGSVDGLWPANGPRVARLGLAGGFFHLTTGYSFPDAARNAMILARQKDLSSPALHHLFGSRARQLWKERHVFQLLNRMLFRAAEPEKRYKVLEHFYRLPEATIGRFYASSLTMADKLRIVTGKPPVAVGKAIRSLAARA